MTGNLVNTRYSQIHGCRITIPRCLKRVLSRGVGRGACPINVSVRPFTANTCNRTKSVRAQINCARSGIYGRYIKLNKFESSKLLSPNTGLAKTSHFGDKRIRRMRTDLVVCPIHKKPSEQKSLLDKSRCRFSDLEYIRHMWKPVNRLRSSYSLRRHRLVVSTHRIGKLALAVANAPSYPIKPAYWMVIVRSSKSCC